MSDAGLADGRLLRRYREDGDEAAFAELRRRYERLVLATARRETGDATLAEDVAQGVFLLLTKRSFPEEATLAGWLHGSARLVARNLVRERDRRIRRERRAFKEFSEPAPGWNAISPHIDEALSTLKPRDREAVLLRFAGEMSLAEVGRSLGIGENAARMCVTRALDRMRLHLRRAGVGVSVVLLGTLLSTEIANAEAPVLPRPADSGSSFGRGLSRIAPMPLFGLVLLVGTAAGGGFAAWRFIDRPAPRWSSDPLLTPTESDRLFTEATGSWSGTLEYADDATGERVRTTTDVTVDRPGGRGLRLTARYPTFARTDVTTITGGRGGSYAIVTGGPESSHRLDGAFELVRLPDGSPAFVGYSPSLRAEVRLRVQSEPGTLEIREETRRAEGFRFRNRYSLRHATGARAATE